MYIFSVFVTKPGLRPSAAPDSKSPPDDPGLVSRGFGAISRGFGYPGAPSGGPREALPGGASPKMPPPNDDQMAACPLLGCFGRLVAGSQPHPDDPGTISRGFGAYRGGFPHWGPWPPVRPSARPARNRPRTTPGPYHGDLAPYRAGSETGSPGRPSGLPRRPARNRRGPSLKSKINDFT